MTGTKHLDAIFENAPIGLGLLDRGLRFVRVNRELAAIDGVPVAEHAGRTVAELLPEMDPRVGRRLERVLATGEPLVDAEFVGVTDASEEPRTLSASAFPVREESGEITGLGLLVLDITERRAGEVERERALELERAAREGAEEAARRARFLAEAGVVLDESPDYEATLAAVSRLVVPWLADWCAIDMVESDGKLRRVAAAHVDPRKVEQAAELERRHPVDPASPVGVPSVIRSGRSEIYPEVREEMIVRAARDDEHLALIRSLGIRSAMIVPMIAHGRTLGAITFVAAERERRYGDDDLLLAEELARRAATSVETARLYSERSYIARTLQESLLPPHLPDIPGLEIAGRYRPVGKGNEVGGDFYDVFEIGGRSWAVVIGDVCGKGADAAALTALVRYTVRALATADKLPSDVLRLLNDAILRQRSDNRFCTVAYARATQTANGLRLELSSGGHPLPVVVRSDGGIEVVGEPGTLLGVMPDPDLVDVAVDLGPGDTLVLYTDGVSEAGAPDRLFAPDELAATLAEGCDTADAGAVAACLEEAAVRVSRGEPMDDIAIVVLHVPKAREPIAPAPVARRALR